MNFIRLSQVSLLTTLFTACAAQHSIEVAPVGPQAVHPNAGSTSGTLIVYSAWDNLAPGDMEHQRHTSYAIYSPKGELVQKVANYRGGVLEDPTTVEINPGEYKVKARVQGYGRITIPVTIIANRTTTLYLDDTERPNLKGASSQDLVKLPDGRVIGWKAPASN